MFCFHPGSPDIKPIDVACTYFAFFKPLRKDVQVSLFSSNRHFMSGKHLIILDGQKAILKKFVLGAL